MKYQRKSNQGFDRFLIHEWLESCEEISATEECGILRFSGGSEK